MEGKCKILWAARKWHFLHIMVTGCNRNCFQVSSKYRYLQRRLGINELTSLGKKKKKNRNHPKKTKGTMEIVRYGQAGRYSYGAIIPTSSKMNGND